VAGGNYLHPRLGALMVSGEEGSSDSVVLSEREREVVRLIANGYTNPDDPAFDRGPCDQDRTHIVSFSAGAQMPQFSSRVWRAVASDWRVAGIVSALSGQPVNVIAGQDRAFTGIQNQRVNQVLDNPYGDKTLNNWLNPAAFAQPAPGTLGNFRRNSVRAPGFWSIDMALSRVIRSGGSRSLELRVEAFNLLNTPQFGFPNANIGSATAGRITTTVGDNRQMQFALKLDW